MENVVNWKGKRLEILETSGQTEILNDCLYICSRIEILNFFKILFTWQIQAPYHFLMVLPLESRLNFHSFEQLNFLSSETVDNSSARRHLAFLLFSGIACGLNYSQSRL